MSIYEMTKDKIEEVPRTNLADHGFRERHDLQRLLRHNVAAVAPDTYVVAEEYCEWEDARRRIDLLCIDKDANLVVLELKRTEDGGHMELQSIRYAAMVSNMTFAQAVEAHARFLDKPADEAEAALLAFLGWEDPHEKEFGKDTRIVLVSGEFSKEITTSAYWLNEHSVDVRCVRLRPYSLGDRVLLDIQQVIPLPEAAEILIKIKNKAAEERKSESGSSSDWTRFDLHVNGEILRDITKRELFLRAIHGLIRQGVPMSSITQFFPPRKFISLQGRHTPEQFREKATQLRTPHGGNYDLNRYFTGADQLLFVDGKTYALTNQWGRKRLPSLDSLLTKHPEARVSYTPTANGDG